MDGKVKEWDKKVKGVSYSIIRDMFLNDRMTLTMIAKRIGCSFQRIGQVLDEMGIDAVGIGRMRRKENAKLKRTQDAINKKYRTHKERRLRDQRRKTANLEKYRTWLTLWQEGLRVTDIAVRNGISGPHASVVINRLRRKYGWFPLREMDKSASRKQSL